MRYFTSSILLTITACFLMISPAEAKHGNELKGFTVKNKVIVPPGQLKGDRGLKIGHTIGGTRGLKVGHHKDIYDPFRFERLFIDDDFVGPPRGLKIGKDIGGTRGLKVGKDIGGNRGVGPR